jgi:hypothetical protein
MQCQVLRKVAANLDCYAKHGVCLVFVLVELGYGSRMYSRATWSLPYGSVECRSGTRRYLSWTATSDDQLSWPSEVQTGRQADRQKATSYSNAFRPESESLQTSCFRTHDDEHAG